MKYLIQRDVWMKNSNGGFFLTRFKDERWVKKVYVDNKKFHGMNESRWNVKTNTIALLIGSIQSWGTIKKCLNQKSLRKPLDFSLNIHVFVD